MGRRYQILIGQSVIQPAVDRIGIGQLAVNGMIHHVIGGLYTCSIEQYSGFENPHQRFLNRRHFNGLATPENFAQCRQHVAPLVGCLSCAQTTVWRPHGNRFAHTKNSVEFPVRYICDITVNRLLKRKLR